MPKVLARHAISGQVAPIEESIVDHPVLGKYLSRTEVDKPVIIGRPRTQEQADARASDNKERDAELKARQNQTVAEPAPDKKDDK